MTSTLYRAEFFLPKNKLFLRIIDNKVGRNGKDISILLTACQPDEIQLHAYDAGTNAFDLDVLLLRVRNLIEQKGLFKCSIIIQSEEIDTTSIDQELIEKVFKIIDRNLGNSSFSVEQLSKDMNMDRTGLYRKLVAITGQNPSFFIRAIRLKKAAILLKQKQFSQIQIAERVGFSSAAYFSKCFKKEYGVSPSQYNKN